MSVYIEDYSDKSFVVRGETIEYKATLKKLGGKWNSNLTDKNTGDKFGAWLFWNDKKVEISEWINNGSKEVTQSSNKSNKSNKSNNSNNSNLEEKIDYLTKLVEELCKLNNISIDNFKDPKSNFRNPTDKTNIRIRDTVFSENDFVSEGNDETKPHKRLI